MLDSRSQNIAVGTLGALYFLHLVVRSRYAHFHRGPCSAGFCKVFVDEVPKPRQAFLRQFLTPPVQRAFCNPKSPVTVIELKVRACSPLFQSYKCTFAEVERQMRLEESPDDYRDVAENFELRRCYR